MEKFFLFTIPLFPEIKLIKRPDILIWLVMIRFFNQKFLENKIRVKNNFLNWILCDYKERKLNYLCVKIKLNFISRRNSL